MTLDYVENKNDSYNPFKSIQEKAEFRNHKAAMLMGPLAQTPEIMHKDANETPHLYSLGTNSK